MTETAKILAINGDTAILGCGMESAACASCAGSPFCNIRERTYEAVIDTGVRVTEGDIVRVFLPPGRTILSGFMVLIFPLILFLLFFFLSGPILGMQGEGVRALCGIVGLILGFGISFLTGRINKRKNMPRIIEKAET